jgi:probable F420-dependent oxidoreductase
VIYYRPMARATDTHPRATARAIAGRLGRAGVWLGRLGWAPAAVEREAAHEIEELGYGTLWYSEAHNSKESLSHGALLLAATTRITVASGIANIWVRDPMAMVAGSNALAEAYPERFVLGLGVSHPRQLTPRGHEYARPVATMRSYLAAMDAAEYTGPRPAIPVPRLLGALRRPMLELAAGEADGAHPYLVTAEHTARAREILGPEKVLAPELFVLLEDSPSEARAAGRQALAFYLELPNYVDNLRWLGFSDDDLAGGGSDRLIDGLVAWGGVETIRERVREHLEAGADHVCIQPIARGGDELGLAQLRALAPALLGLQ